MRLHEYVVENAHLLGIGHVVACGYLMTLDEYKRFVKGNTNARFTPDNERPWHEAINGVFVVPPRGLDAIYARRALIACQREEVRRAVVLVCARVDSKWWFDLAPRATSIIFILGRLRDDITNRALVVPRCCLVFEAGRCRRASIPFAAFDSVTKTAVSARRAAMRAGVSTTA